MTQHELGQFLRDRRAARRPDDCGLQAGRRRRTPGLRREEVASLANMSVDYYVRLEQARGPHPSPRILDGISSALRLDRAQRLQLFRLAGAHPAPAAAPSRRVRPYVAGMLARMPDAAIVVTDATYDVVAATPLARVLLGHLDEQRNLARRRFLGGARWSSASDEFAEIAVARLRGAAARYPRDSRVTALVDELRAGSKEFDDIWRTNPARLPGHRTKTVEHPHGGRLRVNCDVLAVPEDDQQVVFMTADPGSPDERALRELRPAG